MPPEETDADALTRAHRRAFRRVFLPVPGDQATDQDRAVVMAELDNFCCLNSPFRVDLAGSDPGLQLAVQEGRRTVLLFIRKAIQKSYEEQTQDHTPPPTVTVEP